MWNPAVADGALLNERIEPASHFNNWVVPSNSALEKEYKVEYLHHIVYNFGEMWPNFADFVHAATVGRVITLSEADDRRIGNRSRMDNMFDLVQLVSTYRSWPEFRNMNTLIDMISRFKNNEPMTMPIVLSKRGDMFLMSGNTKLDIAFMMNVEPKALVIDIE